MACYLIDTADTLRLLLSEIQDLPNDPPSFYFDAEGHKLGRFGTLDLLQIHVLPLQETFIVDIFALKHGAFNTSFQGNSLGSLLESTSITKVFFDVRNDSDAMFSHYSISVNGAVDLQLMEYFRGGRSGQRLASLKRCMERDSGLPSDEMRRWNEVKDRVLQSTQGAPLDDVLSQRRPLPEEILVYAGGDVEYLPSLYQTYRRQLTKQAWQAVKSETKNRLTQSRQPNYDPHGKRKGMGPNRPPSLRRHFETTGEKQGKSTATVKRHGRVKTKHNETSAQPGISNTPAESGEELVRNVLQQPNDQGRVAASARSFSLPESPPGSSAQVHETEQTNLRNRPIPFVKEGHVQTQGKKKNRKQKKGAGGSGTADAAKGYQYPFSEDLDWTLCDKDCGWCGHCYD